MKGKQQYELIIYSADVREDGSIKPDARLHIARHLIGTGKLTIAGCGRQAEPRYRMAFNYIAFHEASGLICPSCLAVYRERELSEKLSRAKLGPPSNTGPTNIT